MLWETLWALVLGFGLSGAVQAFASRTAMQRHLGDHRSASVVRASLYGMASSSCSYAASAMARSLFVRGADFLAAMVFMFASTNLVIELGIMLVVLIGWQFALSELVGGVVMIVLLVSLGTLWLRGRVVTQARAVAEHNAGQREEGSSVDTTPDGDPPRRRIRTAGAWADAASYTMSDLSMLRKEIAIGFVVAGFLSVLVPDRAWSDVFLSGHGALTDLENVVVGPLVAMLTFVCSVGNVPMAAALWNGGISFGGVVAFVFADLISMPLLLIYRKQYGGRVALRLLGLFWLVMSGAGLVTEHLFRLLGLIPSARAGAVVGDTLRWDWTTFLDLLALVAFCALYLLHRNRERFGGGYGYANDPVCGMQVDVAHSPARVAHRGHRVYFCSQRCCDRFLSNPDRYTDESST
ncbi:MAG: permease, partial [Acidimicrobiales bacterium]